MVTETIDIVVGNETSLTILLGDGTGGFAAQPEIEVSGVYAIRSLVVGDLDGDGRLDVAFSNVDSSGEVSNVFILLGDGQGGFDPVASGPVNSPGAALAIALADFNNDGRLDIATANTNASTASIFLGTSTAVSSLMLSAQSDPTVALAFPFTVTASTTGFKALTGTVTIRDGGTALATESLIDNAATFQTIFSTAGVHTLVGVYSGDARTAGSESPGLAVDVAKGSQTISFPALPRHSYGDPPFALTASSSSGLRVAIAVLSGPATIAGNLVTLTGAGTVTFQASQPGDANYLPAPSVLQQLQVAAPLLQIESVANAASFSAGSFAPDSFAVLFGVDLTSPASGSPTIGGSSIQVTDASSKAASALVYYANPAQMNFLVPSNLSLGKGTLTVTNQAGISVATPIYIAAVSPGLFTADASGTGVAAGSAVRVSADGQQTQLAISSCSGQPPVCTAVPIDLGSASDTMYLTLYGTGIRGRIALANVTATIGGLGTTVLYAGAQPGYPGLDQVNLPLNPKLRGRGSVDVIITVDGIAANLVAVTIQ